MNKITFMSTHQELQAGTIRLLSVYSNFFQPCLVHAGHLRGGGAGEVTPTSGAMSLTPSKGRGSCPPKSCKQKRRRERRGPARHSSRLMTCSLRVMMDKDFSRWDEIKIYTRCFRTQLVGRSSSFNSISAAGDGHPESGLSNGAVSWQNLHADTHTYTRSQTHVGRKREKKKHAFGTSGVCCHSWGWAIDAGRRPNHRTRMRGTVRERGRDTYTLGHRQC